MAAKSPAKPSGAPLSHEEAGVTTGALTTQIANIVANLNKKNLKSTLNELNAVHLLFYAAAFVPTSTFRLNSLPLAGPGLALAPFFISPCSAF